METSHSPQSGRSPLLHRATFSESDAVFRELPVTASPEAIESNDPLPQLSSNTRQAHPRRRTSTLKVTPQSPPPRLGHSPSGHLRSATTVTTWSNDDGLSHIDVPRKFGEAAEYWKYYDELSERHDKDMIKILSDNLDILLIFAGLFSAVNTAFIILSLANLSAAPDAHIVQLLSLLAQDKVATNPADLSAPAYSPSTQDVRVNSFLSASLACSLLAAFGAVMAKQWVLHYARGTVGTLESQGRTRQRKLNGVEKYRFQNAVETLPILLQVSLIFFFVGLLDYLHSLNSVVAFVVLAFALAGVVVYTVTVLVASFDPQCPFQTPVSIFLQQSYTRCRQGISWYFGGVRKLLNAKRKRQAAGPRRSIGIQLVPAVAMALGPAAAVQQRSKLDGIESDLEEVQDPTTRTEKDKLKHEHQNDEEDMIDNQTACWIVETSEHKDALLSAARNIPSLRKIEATQLNVDGVAFDRLLSLFKESLATWRASGHSNSTQSGPLDTAIIYGRALCHSVVGSRGEGHYFGYKSQGLQWPRWRRNMGSYEANEFNLMKMCVKAELPRDFCINHQRDTMPRPSSALPVYMAAILEPSVEHKDFRVNASKLDRLTLTQWLISMCLNSPEVCFPNTVSLSAWALGELPALLASPKLHIDEALRKRWWDAYTTDCNLYQNFVKALEVYHHYERLPTALHDVSDKVHPDFTLLVKAHHYVETYTVLVQSARTIIDGGSRHQEMLNENTLELDTALRQTVRTVEYQMESLPEEGHEGLIETLDVLRSELLTTMKSLRRDGVEAMLPRLDTSDTDAIDFGVLDEERSLALLQDSPELPRTISKALGNKREGTRYAALAIVHDHGFRWFDTGEEHLHNRFKQAGLTRSLSWCLNDPENFELVSGILAQLVRLDVWRAELVATDALGGYQQKALQVMNSQPTFRRLEVYLQVWRSCRQHPECRSFVEVFTAGSMVPHVTGWIRRVSHKDQKTSSIPQPYVPPSLYEYVEEIRQTDGIDRTARTELEIAFEELRKLSSDFWWTLAET